MATISEHTWGQVERMNFVDTQIKQPFEDHNYRTKLNALEADSTGR